MTPSPLASGAASRPAATRRRPTLHELVRDLAGWTLPPHRLATRPAPDGWQRAWASL